MGSLFSGIGLMDLGLLWAFEEANLSCRVVFQVEIDPFCRRVLRARFPHADRSVPDVRSPATSGLPPVDLLALGFPCEDVSGAGAGAGLHGARSGLWFDALRIIREMRPLPRVIVVENVASGMRRWLGQVRCALRELGYQVDAFRLRASDVAAPHRRSRIFVVAHSNGNNLWYEQGGGGRAHGAGEALSCGRSEDVAESTGQRQQRPAEGGQRARGPTARASGEAGEYADGEGLPLGEIQRSDEGERGQAPFRAGSAQWHAEPGLGRESNGRAGGVDPGRWPMGQGVEQEAWEPPRQSVAYDPDRTSRVKALGKAVVPQCVREVGHWLIREGIL